jgi:hypothetical protein
MIKQGLMLLCVLAALVFAEMPARAQDTRSAAMMSPWSNRLGSQLIFFFEDGDIPNRGSWQSYLTVFNANTRYDVILRFNFYDTGLNRVLTFRRTLAAGQQILTNPKSIQVNDDPGSSRAILTNGRYVLTVTPVDPSSELRAIPFNWLAGLMEVRHTTSGSGWMINAVSRKAVGGLGNAIEVDLGSARIATTNELLDGTTRLFQRFQPTSLYVNAFFRMRGAGSVLKGVPFGNRLTMMSFRDSYEGGNNYQLLPADCTLSSIVFDNAGLAFNVAPRALTGIAEWVLAPDVVDAPGNYPDFLGSQLTGAVRDTGGWLRMNPTFQADASVFGWFWQSLAPTVAGTPAAAAGDLLIGDTAIAPR